MKKVLFSLLFISSYVSMTGQTDAEEKDSLQLRQIYTEALTNGQSYEWLDYLSNQIGGRLSGSQSAEKAVRWVEKELKKLDLDSVWLQPVMVPKWTRGVPEYAYIETEPGKTTIVPVCALGGSVPTPYNGLKAEILEVHNLDTLATLGTEKIKGKIIFYNRPMDPSIINTMSAYGGCVDQRYSGAAEAAKYEAAGVLVRSMNLRADDFPHTGSMSYGTLTDQEKIPAAAISTNGANLLSSMLQLNPKIKFSLTMGCKNWADVASHNVVGQINGSLKSKKYMVVGGHLDSWDLGDGSHDDGAGVVQSIEALRLLKATGYQPKHNLRVVLFMNEENGMRGGKKYAALAKKNNETHVFALESDNGGFTPRGFAFDCKPAQFERVKSWKTLFEPYLIHQFLLDGSSGADIGPLKDEDIILAGLRPDSQRYFDYHHASNDTFEAINKRELELGAATMSSLLYLMDHYKL